MVSHFMTVNALVLVKAVRGKHGDLVKALADEDATKTSYKIKGIKQIYRTSCGDHDAVAKISANDSEGIAKIERVIKSLKNDKGERLVSQAHTMPTVIKRPGDP
jgi:hypothetical protein